MTITPEDLVRREVHYCVSSLVSTLASANYCEDDSEALGELKDQALELASPIDDWREAAEQDGWSLVREDSDRALVFRHNDGRENFNATWGELCEEQDLEPYQWDVFEHWIVSDWPADKLVAEGEKVDRDFAGMTVWARTTTGQAIYADGVIERIAAALNAA